jgi:uncharacterized protein involved in exopolysaccharide biosynthesis
MMTEDSSEALALGGHEALAAGRVFLRRWRWTMLLPLGTTVLAGLGQFVVKSRYASTTTFRASSSGEGSQMPGGLSAIAGQFGIALGDGESAPEFYAALLASRSVRSAVLRSRLTETGVTTVLDNLVPDTSYTIAERMDIGLAKLMRRVTIRVDAESQIIGLRAAMRTPEDAQRLAYLYLTAVDSVQTRLRRTQAEASLAVLVLQDSVLSTDLDREERALRTFLEDNRTFAQSPSLMFQRERLQRRVDLALEAVQGVRRQLRDARAQALNTMPALTVVDLPSLPVEPSWPPRMMVVVLALLVSTTGGILMALSLEWIALVRRIPGPQGADALRAEYSQFRADLSRWHRRG